MAGLREPPVGCVYAARHLRVAVKKQCNAERAARASQAADPNAPPVGCM